MRKGCMQSWHVSFLEALLVFHAYFYLAVLGHTISTIMWEECCDDDEISLT